MLFSVRKLPPTPFGLRRPALWSFMISRTQAERREHVTWTNEPLRTHILLAKGITALGSK